MWFLIVVGIFLVIGGWILSQGFIDFQSVDEKGLAGFLNQIGWLLIYIGIAITIILIVLVLLGVGVAFLLGVKGQ